MPWWTIVIYGAAAVFALQGLVSLMTAHRKTSIRRFFEEELQRRQQEIDAAPSKSEPVVSGNGQKSKAA